MDGLKTDNLAERECAVNAEIAPAHRNLGGAMRFMRLQESG